MDNRNQEAMSYGRRRRGFYAFLCLSKHGRLMAATFAALLGLSVLSGCGGGAKSNASPQGGPTGQEQSSSAAGSEEAPILIGFPADLSASYSFYDVPYMQGAQLAVTEINKRGGVLGGRNMKLKTLDARGKTSQIAQDTKQLISDGAVFLIGTTANGILAEGSVACPAGIPISTGDGTSPSLTSTVGDCVFQFVMGNNVQGAIDANYAIKKKYETAFIISSTNNPYTRGMPAYFKDAYQHAGGKVVGDAKYTLGAGDYSALVTKIGAVNPAPDVIFTPMYPPDTQVFLRQLRQAGIKIPVISSDGNLDPSLLKLGAKATNNFVFSASMCPAGSGDKKIDDFVKLYRKVTGKRPASVIAALGYDEVMAVAKAINETGTANPGDLMKKLSTISYSGVTGSITMNPKTHRVKKAAALVGMENGKFKCLAPPAVPSYIPKVIPGA